MSRNNRIVRNREKKSNGFEWNSNYTKIGIFVFALLLIIAILGIIKIVKNNKSIEVSSNETNISYEYFVLSVGDNLGVIDKNGNKIIEDKYQTILIPNPQKDVFFCYTADEKLEILNNERKKLFLDFEQVDVIFTSIDNGETEKYVLKYKKDNKYGLIDLDGNIITQAIYDEISAVLDKTGSILVKTDSKYGVLDYKGNVVIETKFDEISSDGYCSEESWYEKTGYIVSQKNKDGVSFGYVDYKGKIILDTKYETLERALEYDEEDIYLIVMQKGKKGVFKNKKKLIDLNFQDVNYSELSKVFIVNKNGRYGFYNLDGKVILKPEYSHYSIAGNYISVEKAGKTELFDINGNLVNTNSYTKMIATKNPSYFIAEDEEGFYSIISKDVKIDGKYTQVQYAFDNYFIFTEPNGKTGVINAITEIIEIEPKYDFIILIEGTKALQAIDGTQNFIDIYDKDLNKTVTMEDAIVETIANGYSILYSQTDIKYINENGQIVQNTEVYPGENLYATQENGKWGFSDATGKNVVKCEYAIVTEFNEYGFAGIKKEDKWGVVNKNGKIIVEPTYELDTYYFPQFIGKYRLLQTNGVYCEEVVNEN